MSLSVPQNGVKADSEPVIELFVKVRPQDKFFSFSLSEDTWLNPHLRIVLSRALFLPRKRLMLEICTNSVSTLCLEACV